MPTWIYQNHREVDREAGKVIFGVEYYVSQQGDNYTLIMTGYEAGQASEETIKGTWASLNSGTKAVIEKTKQYGSKISN